MDDREVLFVQLAAFVDGEGTIGIYNKKYKSYVYYHQRLSVGNTDIRLMNWLLDNFGGKVSKQLKHSGNSKDSYSWQVGSFNSYKIIKKMIPYLLLKQEQADNAIELWEKVSKFNYCTKKPMPDHKRKLGELLYQRNKELNKRGKSEEDEEVEVLVPVKVRKDVLDEWLE